MIRRLFWMTFGAVAGVTGYRRLSRLARAVQPLPGRGARRHRPDHGGYPGLTRFLRDVRDGMQLYADRQSGPAGPTLEAQQVMTERSGRPAASRGYPGTDYAKDGR